MKLLIVGLSASLLLASCSYQDRDLAPPTAGPSIAGAITGASGKGELYAVLYELNQKKPRPIVDQLIGKDGQFEFPVTSHSLFGVAAFEDLNGNLKQDRGEYAGYVRFPKVKAVPAGKAGPVVRRNVVLQKRTKQLASPVVLSEEAAREVARRDRLDSRQGVAKSTLAEKKSPLVPMEKKAAPVQRDVVSLGDARFSMAAAATGFRDPAAFGREHGTGLYLVDPYRSNKLPVVFIHGVGGASQDWRSLFPRLDLGRIQPLIYHYPTGLPLQSATNQLIDLSAQMSKRYGFKEVQVVGLGTGGLIAKAFAQRSRSLQVSSLVTLASPWGGMNVPAGKVQRSHVSWDLRSNSPFMKSARRTTSVPHHLFFAYQDARALPSQLDPRVQADATRVLGFSTSERGLVSDASAAPQISRALGRRK